MEFVRRSILNVWMECEFVHSAIYTLLYFATFDLIIALNYIMITISFWLNVKPYFNFAFKFFNY